MFKIYFLVLTLLFFSQSIISQTIDKITVVSEGSNQNAFTRVKAPKIFTDRVALNKVATTTITVDYDGSTPSEAETAFNYAKEIWSHLITASNIKIKVQFAPYLYNTTLGETEIVTYRNFQNAPNNGFQYPIALAKQLDPSISYTDYDMVITFNTITPWNFIINGIPLGGKYDFVTIALHEIAHGLGVHGSMSEANGIGTFGFSGYPNNSNGNYPPAYDKFGISGSSRLIQVSNSATLAQLLTGNNVFFDGSNVKKANNNANAKLYAPSPWKAGSSFAHLDETAFKEGDQNSLMTPQTDWAEVIHTPGAIGLAMLKDLGWNVNREIMFTVPGDSTIIVKGQNFVINLEII